MRRRDLLKAAGALAINPLVIRADSVPGHTPAEADVVVVGGATAALAAQRRTTPLEVPFDEIARVLRDHGAIIPGHS